MNKIKTIPLTSHNRIKFLRKNKRLTLRQLGKKLNIPDNSLSQYENGKRKTIPLETVEKLVEYFDVTIDYLMGNTLTKIDILRLLNDCYIIDKNDPFYLGDPIKAHLKLLEIQLPENVFDKRDFLEFTPKIQQYWKDNFAFLFLCDPIKAILDIDKEYITNSDIKGYIENEIERMDYVLTSTKISIAFDTQVGNKLNSFDSIKLDLMRSADKETIKTEVVKLGKALMDFVIKLDDLPENSKDQYTAKIANKRLDAFIKQAKKQK